MSQSKVYDTLHILIHCNENIENAFMLNPMAGSSSSRKTAYNSPRISLGNWILKKKKKKIRRAPFIV